MRKDHVNTTTGTDLRSERIAAGLKAFEVALHMRPQVHSTRISQIEGLARVTEETAERYRQAIAGAVAAV